MSGQAGQQRRRARLGLGSGAGGRTASGSLSPGLVPLGGGGGRGGGGGGGGTGTMFLHSVNLWNLAFYVFMVFLATLGLWDVFFGFEENKCSMSYMFEYPEYQVRFCALLSRALQDSGPWCLFPSVGSSCLGSLRLAGPLSRPCLCFLRPGRLCILFLPPSPTLCVLSSRWGVC